jgi:hypothetical protein
LVQKSCSKKLLKVPLSGLLSYKILIRGLGGNVKYGCSIYMEIKYHLFMRRVS